MKLLEITVDNFAGGGGTSTGIEMAIGRSVDIAINHDPAAIAMHTANHPDTLHYCEDVWNVNPREAAAGRPVGLAWFSPDCTHHSKARGGKPREKKIRGLAWVAARWAATVRPRVIMLENVEEFQDWGPLDKDGKPIKEKMGWTFELFVKTLRKLGYEVEWRVLRACDYGAPTIRKRLFLIARCDGRSIVWPEPSHAAAGVASISGKKLPYRVAAEIIDWSIPCPSIFERKRPLVENTLRRIARGIQKFVIDAAEPFIVQIGYGERQGQAPRVMSIQNPLGTAVAGGVKEGLVTANLIQYHSESQSHEARGQELTKPIMTLDTSNRYGLVTSHLIKFRGQNYGSSMNDPIPTITAGGTHIGEVRAFLMAYYGASVGQALTDPLGTITTHDRFGLVTIHGTEYQIVDIGMRMLTPRELYQGQGFPDTYIIDPVFNGKPFTQAEQVAKCGNSVSPVVPEALVRANLPEHCVKKYHDRFSVQDLEVLLG